MHSAAALLHLSLCHCMDFGVLSKVAKLRSGVFISHLFSAHLGFYFAVILRSTSLAFYSSLTFEVNFSLP